jgi:hypothetical protein
MNCGPLGDRAAAATVVGAGPTTAAAAQADRETADRADRDLTGPAAVSRAIAAATRSVPVLDPNAQVAATNRAIDRGRTMVLPTRVDPAAVPEAHHSPSGWSHTQCISTPTVMAN